MYENVSLQVTLYILIFKFVVCLTKRMRAEKIHGNQLTSNFGYCMITKGKYDSCFIHMKLDLLIIRMQILSSFHRYFDSANPSLVNVGTWQFTRNFNRFQLFRSLRRLKAGPRNGNHPAILRANSKNSSQTKQEIKQLCKHCRKSIQGREKLSFFCLLFLCLDGHLLNGKLYSLDLY